MATHLHGYPQGGALDLPPEIAAIFVEHVRTITEHRGSPAERAAASARDSMIAGLSAENRRLLAMLARGVIWCVERA